MRMRRTRFELFIQQLIEAVGKRRFLCDFDRKVEYDNLDNLNDGNFRTVLIYEPEPTENWAPRYPGVREARKITLVSITNWAGVRSFVAVLYRNESDEFAWELLLEGKPVNPYDEGLLSFLKRFIEEWNKFQEELKIFS